MSKIIAFVGSPHREGRTAQLVGEIVRGAIEAGAEVNVYYASETNVNPCRGCWSCAKGPEWLCAQDDDMKQILAEVKEADTIVVGSPVYFFQMSAQAKAFLDRLVPLYGLEITPEGPQRVPRFPVKKLLMAYTQNVDMVDICTPYFNAVRFGMVCTPGILEEMDDIVLGGCIHPEPPTLAETLEKAYNVGKTLA